MGRRKRNSLGLDKQSFPLPDPRAVLQLQNLRKKKLQIKQIEQENEHKQTAREEWEPRREGRGDWSRGVEAKPNPVWTGTGQAARKALAQQTAQLRHSGIAASGEKKLKLKSKRNPIERDCKSSGEAPPPEPSHLQPGRKSSDGPGGAGTGQLRLAAPAGRGSGQRWHREYGAAARPGMLRCPRWEGEPAPAAFPAAASLLHPCSSKGEGQECLLHLGFVPSSLLLLVYLRGWFFPRWGSSTAFSFFFLGFPKA